MGSVIAPIVAPTIAYENQLQIGSPSHDGEPRIPSTIRPINTATIPPLQNPANVVKHPTPMFRAFRSSTAG